MADQTRKMTPPKKPVDKRRPITALGPTPLRMITTYMLNSDARKQFKKDTQEYEQKKAAFDEAMERLNTQQQQKQEKAKTATTATPKPVKKRPNQYSRMQDTEAAMKAKAKKRLQSNQGIERTREDLAKVRERRASN